METNDSFDDFLKDKFSNLKTLDDNGFTEGVIAHLPKKKNIAVQKNIVIAIAGILSILIFILSSGYKILIESIESIFKDIIILEKPSVLPIIIVLVFTLLSFYISKIEYNKSF